MKTTVKVSLKFSTLPDGALGDFANTVHTELYAHSVFAGAPVTAADLQAAIMAFTTAKVAQASGGKQATAEKNQRREELLVLLKKLAYYVQINCDDDLATLLSSGFEAVSRNQSPTALAEGGGAAHRDRPQRPGAGDGQRGAQRDDLRGAGRGGGGKRRARPLPPGGAAQQLAPDPGGRFTPGKVYVFRVRVIGTKGETSDWSDPVAQRVM